MYVGNPVHCSCNMRWLQSWLRTTAESSGPRCTDGTLLREMPFSSKHCDERELNSLSENIPGCEIESVPVISGKDFRKYFKMLSQLVKLLCLSILFLIYS